MADEHSEHSFEIPIHTELLKGNLFCHMNAADPSYYNIKKYDVGELFLTDKKKSVKVFVNISLRRNINPELYPKFIYVTHGVVVRNQENWNQGLKESYVEIILKEILAAFHSVLPAQDEIVKRLHLEYRENRKNEITEKINELEDEIVELRKEFRVLDDDDDYEKQ